MDNNDGNEGILKDWAFDLNKGLTDLQEGAEELECLHPLYFEDTTLDSIS